MTSVEQRNADEVTKRGVLPVGGPIAGPIHDRSLGGIIGAGLAYMGLHYVTGKPNEMQELTIYASGAALGGYVASLIPDRYRTGLQLTGAFVLALMMVGCTGSRPVEQCLQATGAFHAVQLGVEGAMYSDALTAKQEAIAKKVSAEGTKQAGACRTAAVTSNGEGVIFATSFLRQATLSLSPMLDVPALPEFPAGGPQ